MKTAEFGQPCRAPEPGRCRICRCTEDRACVLQPEVVLNADTVAAWTARHAVTCGWADETKTLCDAPVCIAEARREIGR